MKRPSHLQVVPDSTNRDRSADDKQNQFEEETKRLLQIIKNKDQEIQQLKALDENQNSR